MESKKECLICGTPFVPYKAQKYCSTKCNAAAYRQRARKKEKPLCACGCGERIKSIAKTARYCKGHYQPWKGKEKPQEMRDKMSKSVKLAHAEGRWKITPEGAAIKAKKISEAHRGRKHSKEQNEAHSQFMKGNKFRDDESYERGAEKMRGRPQVAPVVAKGPQNKRSKRCYLRSPENVVYKVVNISEFVRTHEHLFQPEDMVWTHPEKTGRCRASNGLCSLHQKDSRGSWKGWTMVSEVEMKQEMHDLLDRKALEN